MEHDVFPGDLTGGFTAQESGQQPPPLTHRTPVADPPDAPRRSRRPLLLALAAVPWLVLVVVLVRPPAAQQVVEEPAAPTALEPVVHGTAPPVVHETPPTEESAAAAGAAPSAQVHGPTPDPVGTAGAVAVVVARAHLGSTGPTLTIPGVEPGPPGRYVEDVAVEGIDMPAPGAAVVRVVAVVLTASGDHYDAVEVIRLAVPVAFDGGRAAPAGQPWVLPAIDLAPVPLDVVPDDRAETVEAAREALQAAGYADPTDIRVGTTEGWPVVAEFTAVAPGSSEPATHLVWLRRHLDGLAVAGATEGSR